MILYRGKLLPDSRQDELIGTLADTVNDPFFSGEALPASAVILACDRLARRVLDGEFDSAAEPFLRSFNISRAQFREMAGLFRKESLEYKCAVELCDDERIIGGRVLRRRHPLGVLLHIAAGNVDILPAYSVVEGLLSGNVNILKLPSGDSGLSVRLLYELVRTEPLLSDYVYVFDVPSTETGTLKKLADLSDGVVVWGGEAAVRAARTMADVNTKVIAWGHKLSFAYAEPDATDEQLRLLAQSVCDTNQLLCSSCQGIFVDTASREEQRRFAVRFFEILRSVSGQSRPVEYGMRAKSAIMLYNERLEAPETGSEVLQADGVGVIIREDKALDLSYLYRNVWVRRLPLDELPSLRRYRGFLQTAAVLTADPEKRRTISELLARTGVVRITSAGNMSRTVCGEAHDGTYALREYSRITETELFDEP